MQKEIAVFAAVALSFSILFISAGCERGDYPDQDEQDHIENPGGNGPVVQWKPNGNPIPLIPFPNDVLVKKDSHTTTGVRLNLPNDASTDFEAEIIKTMNRLDGFGTLAPINVSFSRAIDLGTVDDRSVVVLNIEKGSAHYGQQVEMDYGRGSYPMALPRHRSLFPLDPNKDLDDLVFPKGNRYQWHEDSTNTLILRPLRPMDQASTHAVVLTRDITDSEGEPIRPPDFFEYVYFPDQFDALKKAFAILEDRGYRRKEFAYAWVFTTQNCTRELEILARGLDGKGPLGYLPADYPPRITRMHPFSLEIDGDGNDMVLGAELPEMILDTVVDLLGGLLDEMSGLLLTSILHLNYVDYFVSGEFESPYLIDTEDFVFHVDEGTGSADLSVDTVPFLASVPKPGEFNGWAQPPYPAVLFMHGNEGSRIIAIAMADVLAKYGFASVGIDAAGHGPEKFLSELQGTLHGTYPPMWGMTFEQVYGLLRVIMDLLYPSASVREMDGGELVRFVEEETLLGALFVGRAEDYDEDGANDSGEDFFTANVFKTRDIMRQTIVDQMQTVRLFRSLGYDWNGNGRLDPEEGDWNLDGVPDIGGPDNRVYYIGMSLGGILGGILMGVEPWVETGVLNVPGGGLIDIVIRTDLYGIASRVFDEILGPVVIGRPGENPNEVLLTLNNEGVGKAFATVYYPGGSTVTVTNRDNDESETVTTLQDGSFVAGVPSDFDDRWTIAVTDPLGYTLYHLDLTVPYRGLHLKRNTPEFRHFLGMAQMALESSDPANYAPHYFLDPLPGMPDKHVLVQCAMTDYSVPVSTGLTLARAAGMLSNDRNERIIDLGVAEGGEVTYEEANVPEESKAWHGFRVVPGGGHAYLAGPILPEEKARFALGGQRQILTFYCTDGAVIEDVYTTDIP